MTQDRYHINNAGEPGLCEAAIKCPFGSLADDHYPTEQEARQAYEKAHGNETLPRSSRRPRWKPVQAWSDLPTTASPDIIAAAAAKATADRKNYPVTQEFVVDDPGEAYSNPTFEEGAKAFFASRKTLVVTANGDHLLVEVSGIGQPEGDEGYFKYYPETDIRITHVGQGDKTFLASDPRRQMKRMAASEDEFHEVSQSYGRDVWSKYEASSVARVAEDFAHRQGVTMIYPLVHSWRVAAADPTILKPSELATHMESGNWRVQSAIAANVELTRKQLDRFVTHPHAGVRAAVAKNPNLSLAQFKTLMGEPSSPGREFNNNAIYSNPGLPKTLRNGLIRHGNTDQLQRLASNPSLEPSEVEALRSAMGKRSARWLG